MILPIPTFTSFLENVFMYLYIHFYNYTNIYILKAQSKDQFGILHISHIYDSTKKAVIVEVLSAEHIPGLNRSGKLINLV